MIRTRDFVLVFTSVMFLAAGIGGTVMTRWLADDRPKSTTAVAPVVAASPVLVGAVPVDTTAADRLATIASLQAQIATLDLPAPTPTLPPAVLEMESVAEEELVDAEVSDGNLPPEEPAVVASRPVLGAEVVIGSTLAGEPILNGDVVFYSIFAPDTLIGYVNDGVPLYGVTTAARDECGGVWVAGEYRYMVSATADVIVACYSGSSV